MGGTRLKSVFEGVIIDNFVNEFPINEKLFREIWAYVSDAALLTVWTNTNGIIARESSNRVKLDTPSTSNQTASLNTGASMDVRMTNIAQYENLHSLGFKTSCIIASVSAMDGFIGFATGINSPSVITSTLFYANLGASIGFIFGNSAEAGNQFKAFIQSGATQQIIDTGVSNDTSFHSFAFFVNAEGNIDFFIDGNLVATSSLLPSDPRPIGQMTVQFALRTEQNAPKIITVFGTTASMIGVLNF